MAVFQLSNNETHHKVSILCLSSIKSESKDNYLTSTSLCILLNAVRLDSSNARNLKHIHVFCIQ